ncbi:ATP-dependent DNA ligase Cdc17 [Elasticomyces elasticus]|nr:ATP-dependent DNA ligase Cdc17 [Elasticomyces elasticus]
MPPKQATLGYVKSGQQTIGKFFGGQNGDKSAAPQQSKLKFGAKAGTQAKKEEVKAEAVETNGTNGHVKDDDVDMEEQSTPAVTAEEADVVVKEEPASTASTKKRSVSEASEAKDDEAEAEAPPSKKRKQKVVEAPKAKKGVAVKKGVATKKMPAKAKPVVDDDDAVVEDGDVEMDDEPNGSKPADTSKERDDSDEDDVPLRPKKSTKTAKTPPVESKTAKTPVSDEDDESVLPKKSSKAVKSSSVESKPAAKSPAPDEDEDSAIDSDEDSIASATEDEEVAETAQPAAKKKPATKKSQSTLAPPVSAAYPDWKAGDPVPYAALCATFSRIELTTKRLQILAMCSAFLQQVLRLTPADLLPTVLLMTGKLAADYSGIELGIGESLIMKAVGETTGRSAKVIKDDQQKIGDLGLVAAKSRGNQPTMFKPKPLTVRGVHEGLMKIAIVEGQGAQGRKVDGIKKLLSAADVNLAKGQQVDINKDKGGPSESKFIIRALEGKMRLGLADKTLQVALAQAMVCHDVAKDGKKVPSETELKKGEEVFKTVYSELPAYEVIVPALLKGGIWKLREECRLQPGVPLKPMLAKPTKSIGEVLDRFEGKDFTCEYKYDGERAQIHFVSHDSKQDFATTVAPKEGKSEAGISNIFSRNSEDLSKKYPDILAKLPTWVKGGTESFVLDCETVAWDVERKSVLPFQQLMTRKRKDVKAEDVKVKVCVFAFDLLYLNGEAIVAKSFRERRELLHGAFEAVEGEFAFAQHGDGKEIEEIQVLLEESIKASCEGLMVKMLDGVESHYEPSRRSQNWLKVKKDYLAGAGDSLDLVVLGAYYGKGKRTSVFGAFQLACFNERSQKYETVCNIGTGFSEVLLEELHETLSPHVIDKPKPFYDHSTGKNDQPDVWFEAKFVWEVKTADLTLSPRYRAANEEFGSDGTHKGVSLRFPRFIRVREDKKADDATTSVQVAEMYRAQAQQGKEKKGPAADDDFEY